MREITRLGNLLGAAGITAILLVAFAFQFRAHELPCPLCLLQRVAFALCGFGFLLNLRYGVQPSHYGLILLAALYGVTASGRQTLLHIVPGTGVYGEPILGLHYYVWALLLFVATIVGVAILLILSGGTRHHRERNELRGGEPLGGLAKLVAWLLILVTLGNAVATMALCGPIECPDNPTTYWIKAHI
jgi:disulfide bond formation protein DsbB